MSFGNILACFETCLFGQGLRRLASFGGSETLRLLTSFPTVLTPFWTGIASFGRGLRRLAFFGLWMGIASFGFFWGETASSHEFSDCFDTFLDGDCVVWLSFGLFWMGIASFGFFWGETASSHEFSDCFDTFFGWGLRRLASFGGSETLRLLTSFPTVLTPFWMGIASFGFFWGETASSHEFSDCFDTFFGRGLRRLASFGLWMGIASFGFFWGETASSHEFSDCFDTFLDGDCVVWLPLAFFGWGLRRLASFGERLRLLTSFPTVLTLFWTGIASLGFFGGGSLCVFS